MRGIMSPRVGYPLAISSQQAIKLAVQVEDATGDGTRVIVVRESQRGEYAPSSPCGCA